MKYLQKQIKLPEFRRGFHLITSIIERDFEDMQLIQVGLLHLFIQHTSASLSINENADPTVRVDFESHFNQMVPENASYYRHTMEGSDDMSAHIKASLLDSGLTVPITSGRLNLGT